MTLSKTGRLEGPVILSEAKDHLATLDPLKMILRFAQDDGLVQSPYDRSFIAGLRLTPRSAAPEDQSKQHTREQHS